MAVFNEILVGRVNRFLQKLLGMKGPAPAPSLAGDVMTTLPLFVGVESLLHQGWEKFGAADDIAAVAANFSKAAFTNPAGSNVVAVIEKIAMGSAGAASFQLRVQSPAVADFGGLFAFNNRFDNRGRPRPTCHVSDQNSDAVFITGTIVAHAKVLASTEWEVIRTDGQQIPVLPDTTIELAQNAVNADTHFSIWWRERFLEETERT